MSDTLNLLSDSTFADKMDSEIAALNGIKNAMGGNLAGTIATIETSPAAVAHAVGEYIYYNSELYKVTAAIAIGDTLTAGTNITKTTVMGEMPSVVNSVTSGDTSHVPTGDAVYQAIQTASGKRFLVPKPMAQTAYGDDVFLSTTRDSPSITRIYSIINNNFYKTSSSTEQIYIWIKEEALGLNSTSTSIEAISKILIYGNTGFIPFNNNSVLHTENYPYFVFQVGFNPNFLYRIELL